MPPTDFLVSPSSEAGHWLPARCGGEVAAAREAGQGRPAAGSAGVPLTWEVELLRKARPLCKVGMGLLQ